MTISDPATPQVDRLDPWHDFAPGDWCESIDVRDFIQQNYTPYDGDESFLADATERTQQLWEQARRTCSSRSGEKGVLDVSQMPARSPRTRPATSTASNEIIVGLQTDAPLKRAIMPNGGLRMVVSALKTYGYEPDPRVVETFTKYRKTHNDGVFDAYTPDILRVPAARTSSPACPTPTAAAASSATTAAWRSTASTG